MTEERKYAISLAAMLLCARKLMELDSDRPSPAKVAAVENAISQAELVHFANERDRSCPKNPRNRSIRLLAERVGGVRRKLSSKNSRASVAWLR